MNEEWKPITNFKNIYEVSNFGKIKNIKTNKILKTNNSKGKYLNVSLYINGIQKNFYVHRLVALEFILNPTNMTQVNHIDGNKQNNNVSNLEWCSNRENTSHSYSFKSKKLRGAFYIKKTNKWKSVIIINNKRIHLGHYSTEIEAHNKYLQYLKDNNLTNKYI